MFCSLASGDCCDRTIGGAGGGPGPAQDDGWRVTVYPLLGRVPVFGADLNFPNGGGGDNIKLNRPQAHWGADVRVFRRNTAPGEWTPMASGPP